jgi:hypothetical protein
MDSFKSRSRERINNIQEKIEDQIDNGIKRMKKKTLSQTNWKTVNLHNTK